MSGNVLFLIRTGDIKKSHCQLCSLSLSLCVAQKGSQLNVTSVGVCGKEWGGNWLTCLRQLNWLVDWWAAQSDDYRAVPCRAPGQSVAARSLSLVSAWDWDWVWVSFSTVGLWHGLSSAFDWHVGAGSLSLLGECVCVWGLLCLQLPRHQIYMRCGHTVCQWQVATTGQLVDKMMQNRRRCEMQSIVLGPLLIRHVARVARRHFDCSSSRGSSIIVSRSIANKTQIQLVISLPMQIANGSQYEQ